MDTSLITVKEEADNKGYTTVRRSLRLQTRKLELGEGTITSIISTTAVTLGKLKGVEKKFRKQKVGKIEEKKDKRIPAGVSGRPWPPLTAERFGIVQEELAHNPFHLIVSTIFLNRTRGSVAKPFLWKCLETWPTPETLSEASLPELTALLQPLGLHNIRAARLVSLAKTWITHPPIPFEGTVKYNYPARDTIPFPLPDYDGPKWGVEQNYRWEIGHLPGVGAYALDSWRIFCCDQFRGNEDRDEWRRVVPKDKELRAYCRWRWAKEGIRWREEADELLEVEGRDCSRDGIDGS
ncbi:DNA glycosylase [Choiromyces venosus 120613-1]|uniref:DNA glycosylase n=1 Tax=Choiromyces venosus 120613-1 TaxID=1336337 RepID=A0A3N4JEW3_9PEZI|nr:DNA glycosylase [Choiromyces venosus 120613-1]